MKYNPMEGLDKQEFFDTQINWPNQIKEIIDGYLDKGATISHGVQKDAIQNGWDPRKNKDGSGWKFTFELIEAGGLTLFTMTDEGTFGLTGRRLEQKDLERDLPVEERWGRFENLAFRNEDNPDMELLGSRGRGKFVFVGASGDMVIFYDSLRGKTYRFGQRHVEKTRSPTYAQDGEQGMQDLIKKSSGLLKPLDKVGTRVVIVNPVKELVNDVKSGKFEKYIGATWWEIIEKFGATIIVRIGKRERVVKPFPENLPIKDSNQSKVWIKENVIMSKLLKGDKMKCKKLHIVYDANDVDEEIRGIAIQRSGMKICCMQVDDLGPELSKHIYGYINLDDEWNAILRHAEGLEHYSLTYKKYPANYLKQFLESEYRQFAQEKLGWGTSSIEQKERKQKNAEKKALRALNRFADNLGLGTGIVCPLMPSIDEDDDDDEVELKKIYVRLSFPKFPRENDLRVNYGEELDDIATQVINKTNRTITVQVKLYITVAERSGDVVKTLVDDTISVKPNSRSKILGLTSIKIDKADLPRTGKYFIVSNIVSLEGPDKGLQLDEKKTAFFVEEDPPSRGLFERYEPLGFGVMESPYNTLLAAEKQGTMGGYIIQYNVDHPEYVAVVDDEDTWTQHLFRIGIPLLCRIDARQTTPVLFKKEHLDDPDLAMKRMIEVIGEGESYLYSKEM